jgi:hypothetical protein
MQSGMAIIKVKPEFLPVLAGVGMNCYQHLWFVPAVTEAAAVRAATIDGSGELVLKVGQPRTAERCKGCGLIVLINSEPE